MPPQKTGLCRAGAAHNFGRVSHIAAALAKSKGKTVTPPPETSVVPSTPGLGVSTPPLAAVTAPRPKSRLLWLAGLGLSATAVAAIAWWMLRPAPPIVAARSEPPHPTVAPAPNVNRIDAVAANKQDQSAIAQNLASQKPVEKPLPTPAAEPAPSASEFFEVVRKFSIAAVKEGPQGRAMIDGKTHAIGAEVAPGLWLREIDGGRLIFRDAQNNEFVRRF